MVNNETILTFGVSATEFAFGRVSVAEARSAAKFVVCVHEEMSSLTSVASFSLHVLLAVADAVGGVALRLVSTAAFGDALAALAAESAKVPMVGGAHVAFHPRDSGLAWTLAIVGTLQIG